MGSLPWAPVPPVPPQDQPVGAQLPAADRPSLCPPEPRKRVGQLSACTAPLSGTDPMAPGRPAAGSQRLVGLQRQPLGLEGS